MTKAQHTPGPWIMQGAMNSDKLFIGKNPSEIGCLQGGDDTIAILKMRQSATTNNPDDMRWTIDDEQKANARLIAASPRLLSALKGLLTSGAIYDNEEDIKVTKAIREAMLAVAEAEKP